MTTIEHTPVLNIDNVDQNEKPKDWTVVLHNDGSTNFHYVVDCLHANFDIDEGLAHRLMFEAHTNGKVVVHVTSRDMAETLVSRVMGWITSTPGGNGLNPDQPCELTFSAEEA